MVFSPPMSVTADCQHYWVPSYTTRRPQGIRLLVHDRARVVTKNSAYV